MMIRDMFADDINRKINGVIKVDQAADDVIEQELNEYVITRELKKHFITFFNYYGDAFDQPTADMGVWISGFFGSGKSHFLKMLSYLLANQEVQGVRTVERFRKKFEDDPATFMLIDSVTKGHTDTIFIELYNVQAEVSDTVEEKNVTVSRADLQRDIRSLISYAVGCMFGRYSLDTDGIVFAGGDFDKAKYKTFEIDDDNILPISDDEYFEDDIVGRFVQFIEVLYGKDNLSQNLRFIADALGGKGTPKEVLRRYF